MEKGKWPPVALYPDDLSAFRDRYRQARRCT
jgi:hypothetical protein